MLVDRQASHHTLTHTSLAVEGHMLVDRCQATEVGARKTSKTTFLSR
jgi:hypothetical protein